MFTWVNSSHLTDEEQLHIFNGKIAIGYSVYYSTRPTNYVSAALTAVNVIFPKALLHEATWNEYNTRGKVNNQLHYLEIIFLRGAGGSGAFLLEM